VKGGICTSIWLQHMGHSGVGIFNCHGKEHDVKLIWGLTSGKHMITADEKDVHFSISKWVETKFEFSSTITSNHIIKIIVHATPALDNPGFHQFDVLVNGCS